MRRVNPPKRKPKPRRAMPAPVRCRNGFCRHEFHPDPDDITVEGIYFQGQRVATRRTVTCPKCLSEVRV